MRRHLTVLVKSSKHLRPVPMPEGITRFDVVCNGDGSVTVIADAEAFARLGGRKVFGAAEPVQRLLLDRVAEAWYAAKCPS